MNLPFNLPAIRLDHEWSETDGWGGFASVTAPGICTRRCRVLVAREPAPGVVRRNGAVGLTTFTAPKAGLMAA